MEEGLITAISQVGFPIVVALYSLIRLEKATKDNTMVLMEIVTMLKAMKGDEK